MSTRRAAVLGLAQEFATMEEDASSTYRSFSIADVRMLAREFLALYGEGTRAADEVKLRAEIDKEAERAGFIDEYSDPQPTDIEYRQMALGYATALGSHSSSDAIIAAYLFRAFLQGKDGQVTKTVGIGPGWNDLIFDGKIASPEPPPTF